MRSWKKQYGKLYQLPDNQTKFGVGEASDYLSLKANTIRDILGWNIRSIDRDTLIEVMTRYGHVLVSKFCEVVL